MLDSLLQEIRSRSAHRTLDKLFDSDLDGKDHSAQNFIQSEYGKRYKSETKGRKIKGVSRMKKSSSFMLFSESRSKPWVNKSVSDLRFTVFRRRKTPASCSWSGDVCIFCKGKMSSTKKYGRRTHTMISSQRNGNININEVGYMARNSKAGISAHYNCLFFTPGKEMIQDFSRQPEQSLEGFDISAIKNCVEQHSKRKCCFCSKAGAVATCANLKCKKTGWYHFPCGLKNGSVQKEIQTKEGSTLVTYCFKCGSNGKRKSDQKEKSKKIVKGERKRVKVIFRKISADHVTGEPIWEATSNSQPSQSSQNSVRSTDDLHDTSFAEHTEGLCNINLKLEPIDLNCLENPELDQSFQIYTDHAEDDDDDEFLLLGSNDGDIDLDRNDEAEPSPDTEEYLNSDESTVREDSVHIKDILPDDSLNSTANIDTGAGLEDDGMCLIKPDNLDIKSVFECETKCSGKEELDDSPGEYFETCNDVKNEWEESEISLEIGTEETDISAVPSVQYQEELRRFDEERKEELRRIDEERKEELRRIDEERKEELRRIDEDRKDELENLKSQHKEKLQIESGKNRLEVLKERENSMMLKRKLNDSNKEIKLLEMKCEQLKIENQDSAKQIRELKEKFEVESKEKNNLANEKAKLREENSRFEKENLKTKIMLREENKAKESLERKCEDYERQIQELKNKNNEQRSLLETMIKCANEVRAKIPPETSETSTTVGEEINNEPPSKKAKNV